MLRLLTRYSLKGKTMVSKTVIAGSSPATFVLSSCSLIRLEYHIANVRISVQFRSRAFKLKNKVKRRVTEWLLWRFAKSWLLKLVGSNPTSSK